MKFEDPHHAQLLEHQIDSRHYKGNEVQHAVEECNRDAYRPSLTRSSAIAEGPREALVSRNPATTKHLTWKPYRVTLAAFFYSKLD